MHAEGALRKLRIVRGDPVRCYLRLAPLAADPPFAAPDAGVEVALNDAIGQWLTIETLDLITCQACGARSRRSYAQGYCYRCFTSLARCDLCVMSPDRCHYHLGTCREPEWGEGFCMTPHTVYLALTSGAKVGITRAGHEFERWADQGAERALRLLAAPTRRDAGVAESALAATLSDRTRWRDLVSTASPDIDLGVLRDDLHRRFGDVLVNVQWLAGEAVRTLRFPIEAYTRPERRRLADNPVIGGRLRGIRGQFLLFDEFAFNVRDHISHAVRVSIHAERPAILAESEQHQPFQPGLFDQP